MKTKITILIVTVGAVILGVVYSTRWTVSPVAPQKIAEVAKPMKLPKAETTVAVAKPDAPIAAEVVMEAVPQAPIAKPPVEVATHPAKAARKNPPKPKAPIQDLDARVALSLVGVDSEAEDYWISAINDPTLPAEERKDLIEDLNEDGLSDPHHPTAEDMPLIASRLRLIEELAPLANDPVNLRAFEEAHKDLMNLLNGLPAD
jgi:hypothetical protein